MDAVTEKVEKTTSDLVNDDMPDAERVAEVCAIAAKRPVAPLTPNKTRVAVLMSGGVDSSVTAIAYAEGSATMLSA